MVSLFSYNLSGSPISDLDSYETDSLSGSSPFVISNATTISGYTEISSIENWEKFGDEIFEDYQEKQKAIRLSGYEKGWSACTNTEKDIIIDYYANPQINLTGATQNTEVIVHLMTTKGLSYPDAVGYAVDAWWNHWTRFLADCDGRWRKAVKIAVSYLSFADASDLFEEIETLVSYYLSSGRLGTTFGDSRDGLINYILSDGGYVGNGMEENSYTLKQGTWTEFKQELYKVLVSEYFWDDMVVHINNLM